MAISTKGFLLQKGTSLLLRSEIWDRKYFVLSEFFLCSYESKKVYDANPMAYSKRPISLIGMNFHYIPKTNRLIIEPVQDNDLRERCTFQVETAEDYPEWKRSLESACLWANYEIADQDNFTVIK